MIAAHTADSWIASTQRDRTAFHWLQVIGGMGAPMFLFLAGVALCLAADARQRRGAHRTAAAAHAIRRGAFIFALAFVFELQSWILSGGSFAAKMLRVDILHVMGLSMACAAAVWAAGTRARTRSMLLAACAVAVAMATPIVRASQLTPLLPDVIEWYVVPAAGHSTFTLFPWAGFLFAGAALGVGLAERRLNTLLAVAGPLIAIAAYGASLLPPIYPSTSFWTSSPTFFFIRAGVLMAMVPLAFAYVGPGDPRPSPLIELGVSSLFVYWVHVELVYGLATLPLHGQLTLEQALGAFALFTLMMYGLVRVKRRVWDSRTTPDRAVRKTFV